MTTTAIRTDTGTVHLLRDEHANATLCGRTLLIGRWMFGADTDDDTDILLLHFGVAHCGTCRRAH